MFTVIQIKQIHSKVKSGADFPAYVQQLKGIGVLFYEHYVADGHTEYSGLDGYKTQSAPAYSLLEIAETSSIQSLTNSLRIHQNGETDYLTFCKHAAEAGIEKWTVDMINLTCTYFDKAGVNTLVENIPVP